MPIKLQNKVILANFTTFKIGGAAKYFIKAKNQKEIIDAVKWAKKRNLPFFVLGNGSNVLFSDDGFEGLVINVRCSKFEIRGKKIVAEAGCPLQKLVQETVKKSLAGLEWAAGIPGTLGGAIYGNAGAFSKEIKDVVEKVKILELKNYELRIKELKNKDCKFGYRESVFKKKKKLIILEATLKLKKGDKKELKEKVKEILKIRKEKQPLEYPSAGSVFKNVPLKEIPKKIQKKFKDKIKNGFLPAAVLIETAGLKGKKIGGAKISEKHANFIINIKNAKVKDILALINLIKRTVYQKFKIKLKEEIFLVSA